MVVYQKQSVHINEHLKTQLCPNLINFISLMVFWYPCREPKLNHIQGKFSISIEETVRDLVKWEKLVRIVTLLFAGRFKYNLNVFIDKSPKITSFWKYN